MLDRLTERASRPVPAASLAAFRVLLGLIMAWSAARFVINGWIERFLGEPTYFFHYWGFDWLPVPGVPVLYGMFGAMVVLGLLVAAGVGTRAAALGFFVIFTWVELIDVTNYLNHYYLVSLLSLLVVVLPAASFRADHTIPVGAIWLVRAQIAIVYVHAGLAKFTTDWLIHAQPLNIWLQARTHVPVVGELFPHWEVALAMSWAGFLYDTTVPIWLSIRRTRPWAYAVLVGFHTMTAMLFTIGMFPYIMTAAALIFFDPDWPLRLRAAVTRTSVSGGGATPASPAGNRLATWVVVAALAWCSVQALVPLRTWLYGGNVLWHEQGMRWSWRVMCREKNGAVTYLVSWGNRREMVTPSRYLTAHQEREMSGQPDMILQLAHHIGDEYRARTGQDVAVHVDAWVSLNGRPSARLIDPDVDLMQVRDGLRRATWITPMPTGPPIRLHAPRAVPR